MGKAHATFPGTHNNKKCLRPIITKIDFQALLVDKSTFMQSTSVNRKCFKRNEHRWRVRCQRCLSWRLTGRSECLESVLIGRGSANVTIAFSAPRHGTSSLSSHGKWGQCKAISESWVIVSVPSSRPKAEHGTNGRTKNSRKPKFGTRKRRFRTSLVPIIKLIIIIRRLDVFPFITIL